LVDAGTVQRKTKKWGIFNRHGSMNRGKMPATHFFSQAVESTSPQLIAKTQEIITGKIEKTMKRHLKKAAAAGK